VGGGGDGGGSDGCDDDDALAIATMIDCVFGWLLLDRLLAER